MEAPRHIAIIMDGNGRWAQARGLPRTEGHRAGGETVRRVLGYCRDAGIRHLTLYAFSVENWKRPKDEVQALMRLLVAHLAGEEPLLHEHRVRLRVMGRRADLPPEVDAALARVEAATRAYERQLIVCLSYGGRTEIAHAARELARLAARGEIDPESIDEAAVARHRPHHPHQRRDAPQQLPPLASQLRRALRHPHPLARLRRGRLPGRPRRLRPPPPPLRRPSHTPHLANSERRMRWTWKN